MKKIAFTLLSVLVLNLVYGQQKTGKYNTYEDYKQNKFADTDLYSNMYYITSYPKKIYPNPVNSFVLELQGNPKGAGKNQIYGLILRNGDILFPKDAGIPSGKIWGFKSSDRNTWRINMKSERFEPYFIVKDGPISLYCKKAIDSEIDKDGNINTITLTKMNAIGATVDDLYISKTVEGDIIELTKASLAEMVKDDAKLAAYVNSKEFNKNKDELSIINAYNMAHKK